MKIAIISDSHDHIEPLDKVLDYLKKKKIQILIHCGDVSTIDTLNYILKHFNGTMYLARGNADNFQINIDKNNKFKYFDKLGRLTIEGKKISFIHKLVEIQQSDIDESDVVFYGHDHKPWMKFKGNTIVANPGNCAGMGYMSTFAVYDVKTNKIKLEIIDKLV